VNAIGIDYGQTVTVLCLREGPDEQAHIRSIGDGRQGVVPNITSGPDLWGSGAAAAGIDVPLRSGDSSAPGPWLGALGPPDFWRGLHARLYSYLGRTEPNAASGYETVIAIHSPRHDADSAAVLTAARDAGLVGATCVRAADALLCRWLWEQPYGEEPPATVVVVAVGDTCTTAAAYRLARGGAYPRVVAMGAAPTILPVGCATWCRGLVSLVQERLREPLTPARTVAIQGSAAELGARIGEARVGEIVEYLGPLREQLDPPLTLTRAMCRALPGAATLELQLGDAIQGAAGDAGCAGAPELVLVGGVGATWPFASEAAALVAPVWHSGTPIEDVAAGATWWPHVLAGSYADIERLGGGAGDATSQPGSTEAPGSSGPPGCLPPGSDHAAGSAGPTGAPDPTAAERPPWEREGSTPNS
jgi:hypothetical protein